MNPFLRLVIIVACGACRKMGGTCSVSKILGDDIYAYGDAADVRPVGTSIGAHRSEEQALADLVRRLNLLFPFGEGDIDTARAVGGRLRLRVPRAGYRRDSRALSSWPEDGINPGPLRLRQRGDLA